MKCTTVLLIYNEEDNIKPLVMNILVVYKDNQIDGEVLLVDDGSEDNSPMVCDELVGEFEDVRTVHHKPNIGRSYAIQTGFKEARGEIVVIMDGDRQYEPREIPKFLEKIDQGYDAVSGFRYKREDVFYRKWESQVYNWLLMQRIFGLNVKDQNSGFKAFVRDKALKMDFEPDGYLGIHRFILPLAAISGMKIAEIPIEHYERPEGSSYIKFYSVPFITIRDFLKFRKDHRNELRKYRKKNRKKQKGMKFSRQ